MARRPALASSWSSAITKRAGFSFRQSNTSLLMEHVPLIRCQRYLGYDQGTITRSAGNHQIPTDQFDSLLHFAEPNLFTKARYLEHSQWLEATAPILYLQADRRPVALKRKTRPGRTRVLTCIGERFLRNTDACRFDRWWQAFC